MRSFVWLLIAATALAGCSAPFISAETKACETFIKGITPSPSTYKRAKVSTFESGITRAALQSEYGAEYFARLPDKGLAIREVFIEFDMQNAFGTPMRQVESCKFILVDKKPLTTGSALDAAVSLAISRAALLNAGAAGAIAGVRPAPGAVAECCIR
jgi:hypothetical protein